MRKRIAVLLLAALSLGGCATVPAGFAGASIALENITTLSVVGIGIGGANLALNVAQLHEERQQRRLACYEMLHGGQYAWQDIEPYCPDGMMSGDDAFVWNDRGAGP